MTDQKIVEGMARLDGLKKVKFTGYCSEDQAEFTEDRWVREGIGAVSLSNYLNDRDEAVRVIGKHKDVWAEVAVLLNSISKEVLPYTYLARARHLCWALLMAKKMWIEEVYV